MSNELFDTSLLEDFPLEKLKTANEALQQEIRRRELGRQWEIEQRNTEAAVRLLEEIEQRLSRKVRWPALAPTMADAIKASVPIHSMEWSVPFGGEFYRFRFLINRPEGLFLLKSTPSSGVYPAEAFWDEIYGWARQKRDAEKSILADHDRRSLERRQTLERGIARWEVDIALICTQAGGRE